MFYPEKYIDEIKLQVRFAFRRIGMKSYQIHQICLPGQKLIYIPIPKNACTSIKHALHEIEFGKTFNASQNEYSRFKSHHDYYNKRSDAFTGINELQNKTGYFRFTVVRDPVERLLSCYRNRVVDLGDLKSSKSALISKGLPPEPDLNTFIRYLKRYRKINKSIEHHSRPQSRFLGGTLRYFDRVYPMEQLDLLFDKLTDFYPGLTIRKHKSGGTKVNFNKLSENSLQEIIDFYKEDYKLLSKYYSPDSV